MGKAVSGGAPFVPDGLFRFKNPNKAMLRIVSMNGGKIKFQSTRIFHELLSRDHEDGLATWQPQGVGSKAYLSGTSQGPTPEDARKDGHIRGRSK